MGILDDAIREHLDLKRRLGADQDEIERLEGEAFGPPSRPGDPDFPQPAEGGEEVSTSDFDAAAPEQAPSAPEDAPFDVGAQESPDDAFTAADDSPPTAEAPVAEPDVAEAPETVEEPPPPPEDDAATDLDLELDLDIEQEVEEATEPEEGEEDLLADEPPAEEEPLSGEITPDAPIESLDTVEHHFEDAIDEAEVVEDEPPEAGPSEEGDSEEDVLEETPEFLRDTPEDDELWFEQGEPKDFDF